MYLINIKKTIRGVAATSALCLGSFAQAVQTVDVYRDPNCGCCTKWISYLKVNGYEVADHVVEDMSSVKGKQGVPAKLVSCHTGVINGKFVEGHVPVEQIQELIQSPDLIGASTPGMPLGSPGMESGERRSAYQVIGVNQAGEEVVLADYPAK
jgi:hypothetical protein